MPVVTWKKDNRTAVLTMCSGPNRMNRIFSEELNACLDQIEDDTDVRAVVLTSTDEKIFPRASMWRGSAKRSRTKTMNRSRRSCMT